MSRVHTRTSRRALTLMELLVVVVITAILTGALGYAFSASVDLERTEKQRQTTNAQQDTFERRITTLIEGAKLDDDPNDTTTFFIGEANEGDAGDLGCDRLTFTTNGLGVPFASRESTDDFETQHASLGPVGGTAEVSWSLTAVGDPGGNTGLFERLQQPSDGDATQGGTESVLAPKVTTIGFQFYNGTDWVSTWDTKNQERRLPAAVQVSYTLDGDDTVHRLIVSVPTSDVDSQNPANTGVLQ